MATYLIQINAKDTATKEFLKLKGAIKRTTLGVNGFSKELGFTDKKFGNFAQRFVGFAAIAGTAMKVFGSMKKELSESVAAYEDFARATNIPDENIKKLDELREKHELMRIEVGQKLMPLMQSMEGLTISWLNGVGIIIDKLTGKNLEDLNNKTIALMQQANGIRASLEETQNAGPVKKFLFGEEGNKAKLEQIKKELAEVEKIKAEIEKNKIVPTTKAQREAAQKVIDQNIKDVEKANEAWIKANDEADAEKRKVEEELRKRREEAQTEEDKKQVEADERKWAAIIETREEASRRLIEIEKEEQRVKDSIRQTTVNGIISVSNTMSDFISQEIARSAKTKAEQKKAAYASASINYAMGLGGAAASIWTTPGGSWQEKLAESIAIDAALTAAYGVQFANIASAAKGADFVTRGKQLLLVGDNPSGRERVQVTPMGAGSGGSYRSTFNGGINITVSGNADRNTVRELEQRIPQVIAKAVRSGAMDDALVDMNRRQRMAA